MSYATAAPLQTAIYGALAANPALSAIVGQHVYDALPPGRLPALYVALGPEESRDASDATGPGAWHDFTVSVVTESAGFQRAKEAAGAVSDALTGADLILSRGTLVGLWFRSASAAREDDGRRRVDLMFRARVEDDGSLTSGDE